MPAAYFVYSTVDGLVTYGLQFLRTVWYSMGIHINRSLYEPSNIFLLAVKILFIAVTVLKPDK